MKPEDHFLFLATHQNPTADQQRRIEVLTHNKRLNWERVFATAERNGVAPLIYENVTRQPALAERVPAPILAQYKRYALRNSFYKKERAGLLGEALKFFREKNIRVIVIKGASLDLLVYDQPWYTAYSDTDLILSPRRETLSEQQVEEINHRFYQKRVEFDFYEHHDISINGMLPIDFEAFWEAARPIQCYGEEVLVLSPEDQLISICINSCRKRFFKLKSLLDISETIKKCSQIDWDEFTRRCRSYSCGNIVFSTLYVAARTVGLEIPEKVFAGLGVSPARAAIIRINVGLLMKFWSLSIPTTRSRLFNRLIDPRLILPYATYEPDQILHKAQEIRSANHDMHDKK